MKKILEIADRPGWAIDRLSKPIAEANDNIDLMYFNIGKGRFLDTGYSEDDEDLKLNLDRLNDYDIIHFHDVRAAESLLKQHSDIKARKIVSKHTERDDPVNWNKFDDVICSTRYSVNQMEQKNLKPKIHHVPPGIDLKKYKFLFTKPKPDFVGFVGRVVPWKRFDLILKSCFDAKKRLVGIGYIEDASQFHKHDEIQQIRDFDWVNFLPEDSINEFYSYLNLFVCASKANIETGPLPVLEAMACGVPVISTPVGWAVDWCEHGKDIWFIPEDRVEVMLSKTIRDVYNRTDIRVRLRNNALRTVQEFSIENYIDNLMKIYETN